MADNENNIVGTFPKFSRKLVENENRYPMCTIHDPSLYWLGKCNSMEIETSITSEDGR
jgi:hypothetical protein